MHLPSYDLRDFVKAFAVALDFRRMSVGLAMAIATWGAWRVHLALGSPLEAGGDSSNLLLALLTLGVWLVVFAIGSLACARGAASEICRSKRCGFGQLFAFARHQSRFVILLPLTLALIAVPMTLTVFPMLCVILGAPILIASVAVQGGDSYEAISRVVAIIRRKPLHYLVFLAFSTLPKTIVLLPIVLWGNVESGVPAWWVWPLAGYFVSLATTCDVTLYLLSRHRAFDAPYTFFFDPLEQVFEIASAMEKAEALKALDLDLKASRDA